MSEMTPVKGYTEMKDSGIEWIPQIPTDWQVKRLKELFSFGKGLPITKADLVDSGVAVISYGQIHAKSNTGTHLAKSLLRYVPKTFLETNPSAILRKGDIILADTSEDLDGLGNAILMDIDDTVFAGYHTIILHPSNADFSKYLSYLFQTDNWRSQLRANASGIKVFSVTQKMLRSCNIILPPKSIRDAITAYLDTQCAKIDEIIAQAKASIEDYIQWKVSVVDECISQALTSSPQVRLKFLMTYIVDCPHETPEYCLYGDYLVIRTADQDYGFLRPDDSMYRLNGAEFQKRSRRLPLEKNDIVYGREGERWGLACLVPESGKYCLGQRIMQFRCKVDHVLPHYAMWALNSRHVYLQGIVDTLGSTSPHVNISTIRNYYIPIPPIPEQRRISTYLFERCGAIDAIIKSKQFLIDDLESYKKSLIYEVVTGKRRVC